jgi:hypothetical protein
MAEAGGQTVPTVHAPLPAEAGGQTVPAPLMAEAACQLYLLLYCYRGQRSDCIPIYSSSG